MGWTILAESDMRPAVGAKAWLAIDEVHEAREATYLGEIDGEHRWSVTGFVLPSATMEAWHPWQAEAPLLPEEGSDE